MPSRRQFIVGAIALAAVPIPASHVRGVQAITPGSVPFDPSVLDPGIARLIREIEKLVEALLTIPTELPVELL